MGLILSKCRTFRCKCKKSNRPCRAKEHHCICFILMNCRHGVIKFTRCVEKGKYCVDKNGKNITCLSDEHDILSEEL